jgi:hypothetical protein
MDEMLIRFSLIFDRWMTTPTPPLEPTDGSVVTGHRPGFPTLLRDVLHCFGYTGFPAYHGRLYRQLGLGHCKAHVDILAHPTDPTMTAWFTMARGDDLDDTLERAAHQALTEFCERHLSVLGDTAIGLLPVQNEGNTVWCERVTAISDPEFLTHNAGWALTARYAQHVSSLLQEVTCASVWSSAPIR